VKNCTQAQKKSCHVIIMATDKREATWIYLPPQRLLQYERLAGLCFRFHLFYSCFSINRVYIHKETKPKARDTVAGNGSHRAQKKIGLYLTKCF